MEADSSSQASPKYVFALDEPYATQYFVQILQNSDKQKLSRYDVLYLKLNLICITDGSSSSGSNSNSARGDGVQTSKTLW